MTYFMRFYFRVTDSNPYAAPDTEVDINQRAFFPQELPGLHNYALRWLRLLGSMIDGILFILVILLLDLIVPGKSSILVACQTGEWQYCHESWIDGHWGTVAGFFVYALIQFHFWGTRGQSLAKIILKTRIVTLDGKIPSVGTMIFLREGLMTFLMNIPGIGRLISIIDGLLISRKEHNTLHDDLARTRVIRARQENELMND
ncbi:MAG: RDD family protein [Akkermansiaceae bacterium]